MKQPYGHYARTGKRTKAAPPRALPVTIHGRHNLEQFSFELQKLVAQLQEHGVFGVQACTLSLEPLDEKAQPKALWNTAGAPVMALQVSAPEAPPPYRRETGWEMHDAPGAELKIAAPEPQAGYRRG
jgi:hypothetical protein